MRRLTGAVLGAGLLLTGCSTTVQGTPVVDQSAVPKPDVGSFSTSPRQVGPLTDVQAVAAEGYRMIATIPLAPDIDPAIRYNGKITTGPLSSSTKSTFGEGVFIALTGAEVAAYTSASDKDPGASTSDPGKTIVMGVYRMKDEAAAKAAVAAPALLAPEKGVTNDDGPRKTPVTVPGHGEAKAFTKKWTSSTSVTAVRAHGRFVLAAYTSGPVELVQKFFDQQIKGLEGFEPTPTEKFASLPKDHDNLLTYTVAASSSRDVALPARAALGEQTDIAASKKNFDEAGVDYVARGASYVYRARDEAGADLLADRFIAETRGFRKGATESKVKGVPGGRCLTYPSYDGAKTTETYCVVPVGRYLAELGDTQQAKVEQALGASYLILQGAK
ncbi:hypothetical protein [Tsukamurella sp. 1534]|uniref:DUF7373 family lipoprotein n=1 Tax=Tsukamurella sp. 1534 TaxID=1151061 RepID=UPI0002EED138|nr:hypothetical protein [Tsukamurella sp. 1534]